MYTKRKIYKCKLCQGLCLIKPIYGEQDLWGHVQMAHEDVFKNIEELDTPDMIEQVYETDDIVD